MLIEYKRLNEKKDQATALEHFMKMVELIGQPCVSEVSKAILQKQMDELVTKYNLA